MFDDGKDFSFKDLFVPLTTIKAITMIVIVGFLVFGNMLFNGFVWDDKTFIVSNPEIHTLHFFDIFKASFFNSNGHYRPIPELYFSLLYIITGGTPFLFHFIQLIIHCLNAVLLFILFRKSLRPVIALILSLVFVVHPLQVESVSYISSSDNPLFFLFGITSLLYIINNSLNIKKLIYISVMLLLTLFTKETGLLFILLIFEYLYLFKNKYLRAFSIGAILILSIYFFVRLVLFGVTFVHPDSATIARISLFDRILNIPQIIFYYLKTLFYPQQLLIDQQWIIQKPNFINFFLPLFIISLLIIGVIYLSRYVSRNNKSFSKWFIFYLFWFVFGIFIHLQIFPLDATVADRWFYFPMVGILGMIGITFQSLNFEAKWQKVILAGSLIVLFALSARTMIRNTNWVDAFTLYKHDTAIETNYDLENALAVEYLSQKQFSPAIHHFKNSLSMYPYEVTYSNLANAYLQSGDLINAENYYERTMHAKYISPKLHSLVLQDAFEQTVMIKSVNASSSESMAYIRSALQKYPTSGKLWVYYALILYENHDKTSALAAADKARKLMPSAQTEGLYQKINIGN